MDVVEAYGLDVAYERDGSGPPLVLLHGAAEDSRIWRPQLEALADEFTVIAWDEPGTGLSSDLPDGFELADVAHCLAALLEALELGPAHVAGRSWGGRRQLTLMAEADHRDLLPRVSLSTLLVWGESEARSPLSVASQFEEAIPDTVLVVIEGAGHLSNLERSEQVNQAVREFVRAHSSS